MDALQFIESGTFEISDGIVFEEMDAETARKALDIAEAEYTFATAATTDALSSASEINTADTGKKGYSQQPYLEAFRAIGGKWSVPSEEVLNEALNAEKAADFAVNAGTLTFDLSGEPFTKATSEALREMNKKLGSSVLGNVLTNELTAGINWSTPGPMNFGGNLISLNSDNSIQFKTPVLTNFTDVTATQSNHQFNMSSNQVDMADEKFTHVGGSKTEVSTNSLKVSSANEKNVATQRVDNVVETHQMTANNTQLLSGETLEQRSKITSMSSEDTTVTRSTKMVIMAVDGSKDSLGEVIESPGELGASEVAEDGSSVITVQDAGGTVSQRRIPAPTNDPDGGKWKGNPGAIGTTLSKVNPVLKRATADLTILGQDSITKISEGYSVDSTVGPAITLNGANSAEYTQGSKVQSAAFFATEATNGITQKASQMLSSTDGLTTIQGAGAVRLGGRIASLRAGFAISLSQAQPIESVEVPPLPPLPAGVNAQDIENCIPEKYRNPAEEEEEGSEEDTEDQTADETVVPNKEEAGKKDKPKVIDRIGKGTETGQQANTDIYEGGEPDTGTGADDRVNSVTPNSPGYNEEANPNNNIAWGGPSSDTFLKDNQQAQEDEPVYTTPEEQDDEVASDQNDADSSSFNQYTKITESSELYDKSNKVRKYVNRFIKHDLKGKTYEGEETNIADQLNAATVQVLKTYVDRTIAEKHPDSFDGFKILTDFILTEKFNAFIEEDSLQTLERLTTRIPFLKQDFITIMDIIVGRVEDEEGGPFERVVGLGKNIASNIKVVSNAVGDINSDNPLKVIGGVGKLGGLIPGEVGDLIEGTTGTAVNILSKDVLTSIETLTKRSPELAKILETVKTISDNRDVLPTVLDSLTTVRLREAVENGVPRPPDNQVSGGVRDYLNWETDEEREALADVITQGFLSIRELPEYQENGFTDIADELTITSTIQLLSNSGFDLATISIPDIRQIYRESRSILISVLENDFGTLIRDNRQSLENLLPFIVGDANAALYFNLKNIYLRGSKIFNDVRDLLSDTKENINELRDSWEPLYTSIKTIPYMVALMNQYKMPLLAQVNTVLTCLDLLKQLGNVFDDVKKLVKTASNFADPLRETIGTLEDLFDIFRTDETDSNQEGIDENPDDFTTLDAEAQTVPPDIMGNITGGLVTGGIAPMPPRNTTPYNLLEDGPNILPPSPTTGEVQERIRSGNKPLDDNAVVEVENRNDQDIIDPCGNVIYSFSADKADSTNPEDWADGTNRSEIVRLIETLPRMTQIFNSVKESPMDGAFSEDLSKEQILDLKRTNINIETEACYIAPRLNMLEATVEVTQIKGRNLLFRMSNIDILKVNGKNLFPANGTVLQLFVEQFYNNKTNQTLAVFRTEEFFSPLVYNYTVTDFNIERNLGIAIFTPTNPSIHLQNVLGTIYSYGSSDVGNRLTPLILDSYVVL